MSARPWYVEVAYKFGPSAVFAGALILFLTNVVSAKLDTIQLHQSILQQQQMEHQSAMNEKMSTVVNLLQQQLDQNWIQVGVTQRTCLNTSKTDADRIACAALTIRPK